MSDAFGRNPGDPNYDENSETDPSGQRATNPAYAYPDTSGQNQNQFTSQPDPTSPVANARTQAPNTNQVTAPSTVGPLPVLPSTSRDTDINAAYEQYLGRAASPTDLQSWEGNDNFSAGIQGSPEAQAYAASKGSSSTAFPTDYSSATGQSAAVQAWLNAGPNAAWKTPDNVAYFTQRINETGGFTPGNVAYWQNMIASGQTPDQAAGGGSAPATAAPASPYSGQISDEIEKLLGDANSPTDANSPNVKSATDAFKNQESYATDRSREALAERAAQEGMGSGAFDTAIQSELEKGGLDTASFQSTQITNELQRKQQEIQTALTTATGANAQALQLQLAQIQDQLSRAQLGQQNQQFYDNLSANLGTQANSLDEELIQYLLGGAAA